MGWKKDLIQYENKKKQAKKRGLTFTLTLGQFMKLKQTRTCYYTGIKLTTAVHGHTNRPTDHTLDRLDDNIGYEPHNVVVACDAVNSMRAKYKNWMESPLIYTVLEIREQKQENDSNKISLRK